MILRDYAQPLARAPYVILFDLKLLNKDGNWQVGMYTVCMRKKKPQKPPEHTSEHVKSQNFLGVCPQSPPNSISPTFCICPGPPQSSQQPCVRLS